MLELVLSRDRAEELDCRVGLDALRGQAEILDADSGGEIAEHGADGGRGLGILDVADIVERIPVACMVMVHADNP